MLQIKKQLTNRLSDLKEKKYEKFLEADEQIYFFSDSKSLLELIKTFGAVFDYSIYVGNCYLVGNPQRGPFQVTTVNKEGKALNGGQTIVVSLLDDKQENILSSPATVKDLKNGNYEVSYTIKPDFCGKAKLSITIQNLHIKNSPFPMEFSAALRPWHWVKAGTKRIIENNDLTMVSQDGSHHSVVSRETILTGVVYVEIKIELRKCCGAVGAAIVDTINLDSDLWDQKTSWVYRRSGTNNTYIFDRGTQGQAVEDWDTGSIRYIHRSEKKFNSMVS